ncbi:MAG: DUF5615 family PIN-like protein [Chloroflexi bacterium]|nr:DUF5615 family PIN-like protein [Chloroflexota bacterium]
MKIKLDENIDPEAKGILIGAGHDVLAVQDERLGGADDARVITAATSEGRCFLTLDLDFANIFAYPPEQHKGIVVLRHPHPTVRGLLNLVRQFAASAHSDSPEGRLWVVEPGRLRIHEGTS